MIRYGLILIFSVLAMIFTSSACFAGYYPQSSDLILSRFESFSVYTVMTAGLLDGVNPCAFTTIVFLISFLALAGYRKREMFLIGTTFTLAVFITYLLIGLGIFRFLRAMRGFAYVATGINIAIGCLAFILGALSLIDYVRFKRARDPKAMLLKMPQSLKNRIHSVIGSDFRATKGSGKGMAKIAWAAFAAGFTVSLAVFLLGLFGVTSKAFSGFMEKRMGAVKLSTAVLFFILSAVLLILR